MRCPAPWGAPPPSPLGPTTRVPDRPAPRTLAPRIQPDCPDWEMDAVDKAGDIAGIWETDFQKNKLAATAFVLMANS